MILIFSKVGLTNFYVQLVTIIIWFIVLPVRMYSLDKILFASQKTHVYTFLVNFWYPASKPKFRVRTTTWHLILIKGYSVSQCNWECCIQMWFCSIVGECGYHCGHSSPITKSFAKILHILLNESSRASTKSLSVNWRSSKICMLPFCCDFWCWSTFSTSFTWMVLQTCPITIKVSPSVYFPKIGILTLHDIPFFPLKTIIIHINCKQR